MNLSLEQWQEDLAELTRLVTECCAHCWPGTPAAEKFERDAAAARERMEVTESIVDRYWILRGLLNSVGDGHAELRDDAPPRENIRQVSAPFLTWALPEGIVVRPPGTADLPAGTRLLTVNGVDVETLWTKFANLHSSPSPRVRRSMVEPFFWYAVAHEVPWASEDWELEVEDLDGRRRAVGLNAAPTETPLVCQAPSIGLTWRGRTAVLRVPSFGLNPGTWAPIQEEVGSDWGEFRKRASEYLAGLLLEAADAEALIVDLRGNGGGFDYVASVLGQGILPGAFEVYTLQRRFSPDLHKIKPNCPPDGEPGKGTHCGGTLEGSGEMPARAIKEHFRGPVVLLIDEFCSSATSNLLIYLKHHRPDLVRVGRPCSATIGDAMELGKLSNLGMGVILSTLRGWGPDGEYTEGRIIEPDIAVEWTAEDVAEGRDPDLEAAMKVLNQA